MKKPYIWMLLVAALVAAGTWYAFGQSKPAELTTNPKPVINNNGVKSSVPRLIIGDSTAELAITQYSDPQCPICKRFFDQSEAQLIKDYIDTKKAYMEVKVETHIGPGSQLAGEAWYCSADQDKFKEYHDKTFSQQGKQEFNLSTLKLFAEQIGLSQTTFDQCLDDGKYAEVVKQSHAAASSKISSTPTFFIGNQKVVGAQPYSIFKTVIEAEIK